MFLRLGFLVWLATVLLIVVAILYGHSQPSDLEKLGYSACAGTPCFMGISLGMTWHEATAILAQHKEAKIFGDVGALVDIYNVSNVVSISSDAIDAKGIYHVAKIDFTEIGHPEIRANLGSFVSLYGSPCQIALVKIGNRIERIFVLYPNLYVVVFGADLLPTSKVSYITISNQEDIVLSCSNRLNVRDTYPWTGFKDSKDLAVYLK